MTELLRHFALFKQGLGQQAIFGEGLVGTRRAIEHLGYVQIDTISVVERAHHHILWNRVPNYQQEHLNHLVREKQIFEYWYHAASYLPMQDYRYALPQIEAIRKGEHRYFKNGDQHLMNEILAKIKAEGKIRLRDIDKKNKASSGGWWNSSAGRRAVNQLFMQGDVMICERNGMEKAFDLTENCLPNNIDLTVPTLNEYAEYLFHTTLRAHGAFTWKQLLHLKTGQHMRDAMRKVVDTQLDMGIIQQFNTADGDIIYADITVLEQLPKLKPAMKILSPFDNLVIHRDRLSSLFEFDYRMECYVTPSKRVFGYFCLPILYTDRLVGRIDCKVHRAEKRLQVLSVHIEDQILDRDLFLPLLKSELQRFAEFNQCSILDDGVLDKIH